MSYSHAIWRAPDGRVEETEAAPGVCPRCGRPAVFALPTWLREARADGATHACLAVLGGCRRGFVKYQPRSTEEVKP